MPVTWSELTLEERSALINMERRTGDLSLTRAMADRLKQLGLAEQKLGGTGLSRAGKELVARHGNR